CECLCLEAGDALGMGTGTVEALCLARGVEDQRYGVGEGHAGGTGLCSTEWSPSVDIVLSASRKASAVAALRLAGAGEPCIWHSAAAVVKSILKHAAENL